MLDIAGIIWCHFFPCGRLLGHPTLTFSLTSFVHIHINTGESLCGCRHMQAHSATKPIKGFTFKCVRL